MITNEDNAINSDGTHYDIAKVIHAIYKNTYKYNKNWYKYDKDKHRWIKTKEGLKLRKELSEDIHKKFMDRSSYFNNLMYNENDEGRKEIYNKKASTALKICNKLKQTEFKGSIIKECKCLFIDEYLKIKID